jgi:hypothetical protein
MLNFCVLKRSSLYMDRQHLGLVFWIDQDQSGLRMCSEYLSDQSGAWLDPDRCLQLNGKMTLVRTISQLVLTLTCSIGLACAPSAGMQT